MNILIDKSVLFICCLAVYLTGKAFTTDVTPMLLAVISTCLMSYFDHRRTQILLTAAFILVGLFMPWSCVFLPLLCYDTLFTKRQWVCILAVVPLSLLWPRANIQTVVTIGALLLVSACLKYRTASLARLRNKYYDLHDTTQEMALRLKKQNQNLMMKQDTEVKMATLSERNRIAREIHDNVGHLLSRALLQNGALLIVNRDHQTTEALAALKDTLSEAMGSIRTSVHDLHDDSIDLHAQLTDLIHKFAFCPIDFDFAIKHTPGSKLNYALISIVKEALSNIARHSNATAAKIIVREHPAFYQLIIADNGHVQDLHFDQGIGLKNIRDRIEAFHGLMNIETKKGFELFISIPKEENKI